jgi:hypothetical protein
MIIRQPSNLINEQRVESGYNMREQHSDSTANRPAMRLVGSYLLGALRRLMVAAKQLSREARTGLLAHGMGLTKWHM